MSAVFKGADFSAPISFVGMYSDGTHMVKTGQWADIVAHADTLVLRADSIAEFVVGMFLVDSVKESGGSIDSLVMPYLPGARQDRSNPTGDVLMTAHSVAEMANQRRFRKVVFIDPHSSIMPALLDAPVEYPLSEVAHRMHQGYTGIIAPDQGSHRRAMSFGNAMGKPVYYGSKVRDVSTGKLSGFKLDKLPQGGHFLVVDDICDGGGTFLGLGEKILEQGCFADLYVTHGIFSKGVESLKEIYKNIYTTDSRNHDHVRVLTIPVVEDMENY